MGGRYRVTHATHFIGGRLVRPDQGNASIVTLPDGVTPGRWLVPLKDAAEGGEVASSVAAFSIKYLPPGRWVVVDEAGLHASRIYTSADGVAKELAQAEAERLNAGGSQLAALEASEVQPPDTNLPDA